MQSSFYEHLVHSDPDFPIIFHSDCIKIEHNDFLMHWHESPELLYFWQGSAVVTCDAAPVNAAAGDLVVVNSCALHSIRTLTSTCNYYCLIVDKAFCDEFALPVGEVSIRPLINDAAVCSRFASIAEEMEAAAPYYKTAVKAEVIALLTRLFRIASEDAIPVSHDKRLDMVREAITYIRQHYKEALTVEIISAHVGFSKYYFCRVFHEITGKTVVDYINFMRCDHARKLLADGHCNVGESAEQSGFHNLSYFSKTYKRYMGVLPSECEQR